MSARQATFESSFQPPPGGGLKLYQPFMSSPVCGSVPNNFELVQAEGAEYVALRGCESFTVTTVVDRASGQVVSVQMTNPLQLNTTLCQDEALTECSPISPTTLLRTVQLTREWPGAPRAALGLARDGDERYQAHKAYPRTLDPRAGSRRG